MREKKTDLPRNIVPHPRFGDRSVPSGYDVPRDVIKRYYCYDRLPVFPESAIPADVSRQHYSFGPRPCYVDILKTCHTCDRPFLFFAREQQYWFEELGFWAHADCRHCPECRRAAHRLRGRFSRFSRLISEEAISDEDLKTLVADAVSLFREGVLRNEQKLRRLKNLARFRIPESEACRAILDLIARIDARRTEPT